MLKPLTTTYLGKSITLECTHKKQFPPPQMFGHTPQDIDVLWRQGSIDQREYQLLKTWQEHCGIMLMGPRCVDCPLAKKQNPRPGRPHVVTTEAWLPVKEKMHWELKKAAKDTAIQEDTQELSVEEAENLIQTVLDSSDEEIEEDFRKNGEDLSEVAHRVRENLLNVVDNYKKRTAESETSESVKPSPSQEKSSDKIESVEPTPSQKDSEIESVESILDSLIDSLMDD